MEPTYHTISRKPKAKDPRHESPNRIEVRVLPEEKQVLLRNSKVLGISQSALIRSLIKLPVETHRSILDAETALLLVDDVTLANGVNQLRRAGYNIDHTLHALNTLLAKPSMHEERKFELLKRAVNSSDEAAKQYSEAYGTFAALFPSTKQLLFVGRERKR